MDMCAYHESPVPSAGPGVHQIIHSSTWNWRIMNILQTSQRHCITEGESSESSV